MTRPETFAIFGDPIPTAMIPLAKTVDSALEEAERSTVMNTALQEQVRRQAGELARTEELLANATHLKPRNVGGHYYPTAGNGTSDCEYCASWMGGYRSGAPEGIDQFGDCPGNPKLRDAYDLLKKQAEAPRGRGGG